MTDEQRGQTERIGFAKWAVRLGWALNWSFSVARWWGPLLGTMGLIFFLSSRPRPELFRDAPDYVLHFVAYFFLTVTSVRAFGRGLRAPVKPSAVLWALVLVFVYAVSDEWHQSFVPGRVASGWDLLADSLGLPAAWGVLLLVWHSTGRAEKSS